MADSSFSVQLSRFLKDVEGYGYGPSHVSSSSDKDVEDRKRVELRCRRIHHLRKHQLQRLKPCAERLYGITPLDNAASALYTEGQLNACFGDLKQHNLLNPHSDTQAGSLSAKYRADVVRATLDMCNAPAGEYDVVFTSGATGAFKLVSECLPWSHGGCLAYCRQTHNSVLGMREVAMKGGAAVQVVDWDIDTAAINSEASVNSRSGDHEQVLKQFLRPVGPVMTRCSRSVCDANGEHRLQHRQQAQHALLPVEVGHDVDMNGTTADHGVHLAVLPHECNFTGQRLNLDLVHAIQRGEVLPFPTISEHTTSSSSLQQHEQHANSSPHHSSNTQQQPGGATNGTTQDEDAKGGPGVPQRWLVMLDAAKSCSTTPPDLRRYPADFVALSYYKFMGYPTGLGAVIVRKELLPLMTSCKAYFGGGTVAVSCAEQDFMARRPGVAGLEDGTPAFTAIAAARHGFDVIHSLGGWKAVAAHTSGLCDYLIQHMTCMRHSNGQPLVVTYGRHEPGPSPCVGVEGWGPTVAFNLRRPDGSWVGYHEVSRLATLHGIQLRTGCFCNPGACGKYLGLTGEQMRENYEAGHVCWDDRDIMSGRPTGAVRVSLGHLSLFQDVWYFLRFLEHYFKDKMGDFSVDAPPATTASRVAVNPDDDQDVSRSRTHVEGGANDEPHHHKNDTSEAPNTSLPSFPPPPDEVEEIMTCAFERLDVDSGSHVSSCELEPATESQNMHKPCAVTQAVVCDASCVDAHPSGDVDVSGSHRNGMDPPPVPVALSKPRASPSYHTASSPELPGHAQHIQHTVAVPGHDCRDPGARLSAMYVYPIKSCGAQQVTAWPIGNTGLLYDREYALVDDNGQVVTQKKCPRTALIRPHIDLDSQTLTITSSCMDSALLVPLHPVTSHPLPGDTLERQQKQQGTDSTDSHFQHHTNLSSKGSHRSANVCNVSLLSPTTHSISSHSSTGQHHHYHDGHHGRGLRDADSAAQPSSGGLKSIRVCGDHVCSSVVAATVMPLCIPSGSSDTHTTTTCTPQGHHVSGAYTARHEDPMDTVRAWFEAAIGVPCVLVRQQEGSRTARPGTAGTGKGAAQEEQQHRQHLNSAGSDATDKAGLGFANDGQYLLVNAASVEDVNRRMLSGDTPPGVPPAQPVELLRFRPNLVIEGLQPYVEDTWAHVTVGALTCHVLGTCPRCEMLQVDQVQGTRGRPDVLVALAQYRRFKGKMHFGILLSQDISAGHESATQSEKYADLSRPGQIFLRVGDVLIGRP